MSADEDLELAGVLAGERASARSSRAAVEPRSSLDRTIQLRAVGAGRSTPTKEHAHEGARPRNQAIGR
jgi:hypothetical protein